MLTGKHPARHFTRIISFGPHNVAKRFQHSIFISEVTKAQRSLITCLLSHRLPGTFNARAPYYGIMCYLTVLE